MFFWGGYSFNLPQQQEHADRPPLKYPVYAPPPPGYMVQLGKDSSNTNASKKEEEDILSLVLHHRLPVRGIACGLKHAVIILGPSEANKQADHHHHHHHVGVLYGLGSNHNGQLGHRVATYTNTLVDLNGTQEIFSGDITAVACGLRHTLLLTSSGCVYVSGDNSCGQLGLDDATLRSYVKSNSRAGAGGADSTTGGKQSGEAFGKRSDHGATAAGSGGGSGITHFTQVRSLVHVKKIVANHNASFAIDDKGNVYSWGDAQYGQLGHGGDHIVADERGGLDKVANVRTPRLVRWFERHRVSIADVAVGKGHTLFASRDGEDVYSCGEGYFGKLGHGGIDAEFDPRRLESFPERKQREKVVSIAAGDDCSLVLKANPVMGSVVYFFGKLGNGDGQLKPFIIPFPYVNLARPVSAAAPAPQQGGGHVAGEGDSEGSNLYGYAGAAAGEVSGGGSITLRSVACGRGNQCLALSEDGRLFVWGKSSYTKLANGTAADASKSRPTVVAALEKYMVAGAATGGTLMMAWATELREQPREGAAAVRDDDAAAAAKKVKLEGEEEESADADSSAVKHKTETKGDEQEGEAAAVAPGHEWDVVVPHDARVNTQSHMANGAAGDEDEVYEQGVKAFLTQYFGPQYAAIEERYVADMPVAPPRSEKPVYQFNRVHVAELAVGQKVRLWMSNLYAIGTVVKLDADDRDNVSALTNAASPSVSQTADGEARTAAAAAGSRAQSLSQHQQQHQAGRAAERSGSQGIGVAATADSLEGGEKTGLTHNESGQDNAGNEEEEDGDAESVHVGRRVVVEWERDDWRDEVVTLYSDDETLDEANENRWQPFWFEKNEQGDYVIAKSR